MDNLFVLDWNSDVWKLLVRMLAAAVAGFAIGFERKTRSKEAGIRTHSVVAIAACLMMILSKYAFADMTGNVDGARIAAQVVTGIGFLGAGMIVYRRDLLHGLTTAAGIWATAGIGMAFGSGMYVVGACATVMIILIQVILHIPLKLFKERTYNILKIRAYVPDENELNKLKDLFSVEKIIKFNVTNMDNNRLAQIEIATSKNYTPGELCKIAGENPFILNIEKNEDI